MYIYIKKRYLLDWIMTILLFLRFFSQPRKWMRFVFVDVFSSFCLSGVGQFQFQLYFFLRTHEVSLLPLIKKPFFFFSCTGKKRELLLFNLVGLKWEWNLDYSNFSWIRSRMTTELEILLVQLLVASELEKAVITVLIRNDSNINEPT